MRQRARAARCQQQPQHGEFSQNIIGPSERPAQKKRNGAVGQIPCDQDGANPAVQKKGGLSLHHHNDDEVLDFHREQTGRAQLHQQLRRFVVGDEYVACEKQDWNEAKNQEDDKEAGLEQVRECITRQNKKPRPFRRERSGVRIVSALIYGHPPLPFVP